MSVFGDAVFHCLDYEPSSVEISAKSNRTKPANEPQFEKFSGLRIRNQLVTSAELKDRFSDIRFVRSSTIRDAYKKFCDEKAGTAITFLDCIIRKDSMGPGFSLSLYLPKQVLKMGTSVDYGVCNGKSKDGTVCMAVINKRRGIYCKYHKSKESQKFTTMQTELKGGNIRTAFRYPLKSEGIDMVDPLADKKNLKNPKQPVKLLSVEGVKKALSNAGKMTTNKHSQGIRFLAEIAVATNIKESTIQKQQSTSLDKRKSSSFNTNSSEVIRNQQLNAKRNKIEKEQPLADKSKQGTGKMIELDFVSSDEGF